MHQWINEINGDFTFTAPLADGSPYLVSALQQASGQTCEVSNGSGMLSSENVTSVTVNCALVLEDLIFKNGFE